MSSVDNADRQERDVWMVSGIYDDTLLKRLKNVQWRHSLKHLVADWQQVQLTAWMYSTLSYIKKDDLTRTCTVCGLKGKL